MTDSSFEIFHFLNLLINLLTAVLGIKPSASCVLDEHCTTERHFLHYFPSFELNLLYHHETGSLNKVKNLSLILFSFGVFRTVFNIKQFAWTPSVPGPAS